MATEWPGKPVLEVRCGAPRDGKPCGALIGEVFSGQAWGLEDLVLRCLVPVSFDDPVPSDVDEVHNWKTLRDHLGHRLPLHQTRLFTLAGRAHNVIDPLPVQQPVACSAAARGHRLVLHRVQIVQAADQNRRVVVVDGST